MRRLLLLFLFAPLALGCSKGGSAPPDYPVTAVVYQTRPETVQQKIELIGTLLANESIDVRSEINGTVESISFTEGQPIAAGEVLVELETTKLKAEVARAKANFNLAKANITRSESLLKRRTISQQEYDSALAQFEADKSDLERMQQFLDEAIVEAPFGGVVGARLVSPGQFITEGEKITSLVSLEPMKLEMQVPERYVSVLQTGFKLVFRVAAYRERDFSAEVYFVAPEVNPDTRTVLIKATVPNPDHALLPGMFAEISLILETREGAVVIPESAIMMEGDSKTVFIVKPDGTADLRTVSLGTFLPDRVEVLSGLTMGDKVIVKGVQKVRPGAQILPTEESDLLPDSAQTATTAGPAS